MVRNGEGTQVLAVRVPDGLMQKMQSDIDAYSEHRTKSEFALDAIRFYLDYRVKQRIEAAKVKTVFEYTDEDIRRIDAERAASRPK